MLLRFVCDNALTPALTLSVSKTPGFLRSLINTLSAKKLHPQEPLVIYTIRFVASLTLSAETSSAFLSAIKPLSPEELIWRLLKYPGWQQYELRCLAQILFMNDVPTVAGETTVPFSDNRRKYMQIVLGARVFQDLILKYVADSKDSASTFNIPFYCLAREVEDHPRTFALSLIFSLGSFHNYFMPTQCVRRQSLPKQ